MALGGTQSAHDKKLSRFHHKPLHSALDQIRLLQFAAHGSSWLPLYTAKKNYMSFELRAYRRDACPSYVAISYTWGPATNSAQISINGSSFTIRRNLADFLEILSQDQRCRKLYFWIDQICINQDDDFERNLQVERMDKVYTTAEQVFAWLGPSTAEHDFVWYTLCQTRFHSRAKIKKYDVDYTIAEGDRHKFVSFLERDYWCRLWIVQEVLLARRLEFWYGRHHHDANVAMQTLDRLPTLIGEQLTQADQVNKYARTDMQQTVKSLAQIKLEYTKSAPQLFLRRVIACYSTQLCSDPRDLVYGVQALVRPEERIRVDYTRTSQEIFQSAIKLIMFQMGTATWTDMYQNSSNDFLATDSLFAMTFWERLIGYPAPAQLKYNIEALSWSRKVYVLPTGSWTTYECAGFLKRHVTPAQQKLEAKCYELLVKRQKTFPVRKVILTSWWEQYPLPRWIEGETDAKHVDDLELLLNTGFMDDLKDVIFEAAAECGFQDIDGFLVHGEDPHPDKIASLSKSDAAWRE